MSSEYLLDPQSDWVIVNVESAPSFVSSNSWKEETDCPKQEDPLRSSSKEILRTRTKHSSLKMLPERPEEISQSLSTYVNRICLSDGTKSNQEAMSKDLPPHVSSVEVEVINVSNRKKGTEEVRSKDLRHVSKEKVKEHESFCRVCFRGGPFMKCHSCTDVYHKNCLCEAAWKRTAEGTWLCPNCT